MDEYTIDKGVFRLRPDGENAAGRLVDEIIALSGQGDTEVLVVVGHGNNRADGLCAARWLR